MLKFVTNPIKPLPALDLIEYRHASISVNLLEILHNRRSTEYNKNFGGCKGRKLEPATPSSKESRHQAEHQQLPETRSRSVLQRPRALFVAD